MRRTLGLTAAALLAVSVVPAVAAEEPVLNAPCAVPSGSVAVTPAKAATSTDAPPSLIGEASLIKTYVVDLAGLPSTTTASLAVDAAWDIPVNDYDLTVTGPDGGAESEGLQPIDPPSESVVLSGLPHCAAVTSDLHQWVLAPGVVDEVTMTATATVEESY